jgi:hypothetical protein
MEEIKEARKRFEESGGFDGDDGSDGGGGSDDDPAPGHRDYRA